mmetsp:Transcript_110473/g.191457  ORF Transcript_110473/g.191457 Transcript_110473/m.191457 type:complete len:181 (-) Transcript_110473:667-1209(-)
MLEGLYHNKHDISCTPLPPFPCPTHQGPHAPWNIAEASALSRCPCRAHPLAAACLQRFCDQIALLHPASQLQWPRAVLLRPGPTPAQRPCGAVHVWPLLAMWVGAGSKHMTALMGVQPGVPAGLQLPLHEGTAHLSWRFPPDPFSIPPPSRPHEVSTRVAGITEHSLQPLIYLVYPEKGI